MPYTDDQIEYLQSAAPDVQAAAVGKLSDSERSDLMSSLTAYKAKKNPPSRPTPAGATGEISSLSPEDSARSEARNEREGTPLEQMTGQGGALKTLPRRFFQAAAYDVGKSATDALSIPGGLTRLAALPAYTLGMKTVGDAYNHFADYISPSKDIETVEAQAPKTPEGKVVAMAAKFASDVVLFGAGGKVISGANKIASWALPSIFAMNSASSAGNTAHQNNQDVEHPVRAAIGAITDAGLAYLGGTLFGKAPGSNLAVKAASGGAIGSAVQGAQNVVAKYTYDPKRSLHDGVVQSALTFGAGALAHGLNQRSALREGMETHPQGPNGFMQDMQSAMDNAERAKHEGRLKPGAYQDMRNAWDMARNIHEKLMGSEAGKKFQAKAAAPEEFPAARKLFNRDTPPAQEEAQNAVQVGRPEEVVPREGGQGRNLPEGGQGVGQGLEGEETPSQGQAQEEGQVTRLPRELAGAKPRYNIGVEKHTPVFENDIDKALFIVAQTTPSRNDAKYMEWLQDRFPDLDQDEIRDKGKEIKAEIKKLAKGNKGGGELPVPDQQPKPVPKPPVANGRKLPIISEDELGHPAIARDVTPEPVAPEGAPSPATPEENETEYQEHQNAQPRIPAASQLEVNDRVHQVGSDGKAEARPGVEGGPENAPASGGNGVQDESAVGRLRSAKSNAIKTFTDTGESKIKPHHLTLHKGMNPRKGAEASMALGSDEILSHPDSGTLKSGTSYNQEGNTVIFGLPDAMGSLEVSLHPSKGVASFDHIHVSENIKGKGKGKDFMQEAARFINAAYPEVHTVYLEATTEDAHNIMASYPGAVRDGKDYVIPIGELANRTSHPKAEAKPNPMAIENPARSEGDAGLGQEVAKSEEVATPTRKTKRIKTPSIVTELMEDLLAHDGSKSEEVATPTRKTKDIKKPVPTKELTPKQALEDQNKAKIQEHVDSIDGDDAIKKAIRANLYKKGLLSQVNLTPENIKAAADKEWTNIMTRRKQQAGFIDLGGIADAFRDMKDRLFPDRGEEDPPSKSEIMNKVRQQTKKNVLPVDLKNVNLEDGINRLLAHIYLQAGGAGIDEDGQPIVGPAFFPIGNATDPSRDATKFEKFMSNFGLLSDNPAAIMEGGIDTIMNDPLFGLGQSPVSDAGFANIRKASLHDNLTRSFENLLSPFPNVTREVESEIKPIFKRYSDLRGSQLALEEQLGVIPQIEGLKEDTAVKQGKIKKAKHALVNLIDPPAGVEPAEQTEARSEARKRITKEINKLQTGVEKNQSKIEKLVPDIPKDIRTTARWIRYKDINKKLELERKNLYRKIEELGKKHPRVRIAVAAFHGADADTYPEWLSKAITPEEQSVAEKVRYFFDNLAGPALEREGVPTRDEMDHFMHQPNGRYLEPGENKWVGSRVRPKDYREQPLDPDSVRFQSKTDNALLWYPEIGGILDSYSNVFPDILSKRELANRWEPAVTEMRAQGQNRIADMTESYLNGQIHGTERSPILDTLTNWFYFKHLALNPSPALLHAVKQVLNPTMLGPAATAKGYAGMAPARFGASDASHLAGEAQRLWRSGQGAGQIMSSDSGVAPLSRIGKTAYSLGLGALTGRVEMFDRNLTFLSSLEFAKQNGQSDEEAMQTAMGTTLAVNFLSVDRAKSFRGPVGRAAFAFGGTPKKLSEFGRRVTNDAIRAGVKAAKGSKYGWEREPGKPWAAKGDAGQNLRKIQSAVVYALTAAALKVSDDLLDTHKLLKGQFHPGKYVDIANGLIHGHVGPVVGAAADIAPALTETANDIEKLGYVGILSELAPDILVKGAIAANSGAPSNQGQWGDTKGEQAARYLLNTPHASIVDAKEEASAARAQKTQARNWEILKHNIGLD